MKTSKAIEARYRGGPPSPLLKPKSNRGHALIGTLVSAIIMAIVMMAFMTMFQGQARATRNIAARGGVTDLSHALDTLFGSPGCATTGSANYISGGASPVYVSMIAGSLPSYSLSLDRLQFSNGALAITSNPSDVIAQMIQPNSILSIIFTPLGGNNGTQYPFKMTVTFANANGPPPLPINKFVTIYTDPDKLVKGACYSGQARPQTVLCYAATSYAIESYGFTAADCGGVLPDDAYLCAVTVASRCNGLTNFALAQPTATAGPRLDTRSNGGCSLPTSQNYFGVMCAKNNPPEAN